jgi:hypothetical protein
MRREDHRMGVTPITLKRAAYYLCLGEGEYYPDHPHFDKVVVSKLYDITQSPLTEDEWSLGMRVDFYSAGRITRWIEFGCRTIGAGGDDILRKVDENV